MNSKALTTTSTPALFFYWWYLEAPARNFKIVLAFILRTIDTFSIPILFKTLFAPWKRDIISTENLSLNERFQVWIWNLISRLVGAVIRSVTIFTGLIFILIVAILGIFLWLLWFLLPFIFIFLVFYGLLLLIGG